MSDKRDELLARIGKEKIIAIVRGVKPRHIVEVGRALLAGGVSLMEVTFDHSGADGVAETLESLELLAGAFSGSSGFSGSGEIAFGAGTVLTVDEVVQAHARGAEFIISPNTDAEVIAETKELGLLSMPGAFTPTEIVAARRAGGDIVKIFPATVGGIDYVKAVRGPLGHIPLAAVGGVDAGNIAAFLAAGVFCCGIGGNLVNAGKVAAGDFATVTRATREFVERV